MRSLSGALIVAALAMFAVNLSPAMGEERAITDEAPAALAALGAEDSRVLSMEDADEVRGEAFIGQLSLTIITTSFATELQFRGIASSFSTGISVRPGGLDFAFALQ